MCNSKSFLKCMSAGLIIAGATGIAVACNGEKGKKRVKVRKRINDAMDTVADALGM